VLSARLSFVGGLAVAKKSFFIFILISVLVIGSKPKEANSFSLAVAPAVMMNVASALVMGGAMYYCYTHGGKEAWAQLQSATKDGVEVTKDWLISKIAEMNGVSTSSSGETINLGTSYPVEGMSFSNGAKFDTSVGILEIVVAGIWSYSSSAPAGTFTIKPDQTWYIVYVPNGARTIMHKAVVSSGVGQRPGAGVVFDPADYPSLYGPQVLYTNAYHAMMDGIPPVLDWIMRDDAPAIDPEKDQVINVPVVATTGSGEVMDKDGKYHPAPPGLTDPVDGLGAPTLDPGSVGSRSVSGESGTAPVNSALDDALGQAGISEDATVIGVTGQTVTWTDAQGIPHVSVLPPAVALELGKVASNVGVQDVALTGNPVEVDSGSDFDPGDDSFDVPIFDSTFTPLEEKEEIPWSDWLSYVPFMNLIEGSSLNVSGADPIIDVHFDNFAGLGAKSIQYDFSEWDSVFNAMGGLIYAFACFAALRMALVKKG
jgi:hypothetical protein